MQNMQTTYGVFVLFQVVVHKKVRKWRKKLPLFYFNFPSAIACGSIVTILVRCRFQNLLLVEPTRNIGIQTKTCPDWLGWKLWLRYLCNPRTELLEIGQGIDNVKEKLRLHDVHR